MEEIETKSFEVDYEKLRQGLELLNGLDFEQAEKMEHMNGNFAPDIGSSKGFQARLAAKALKVPVQELQILPISEYVKITGFVFDFLYSGLARDLARQELSKK